MSDAAKLLTTCWASGGEIYSQSVRYSCDDSSVQNNIGNPVTSSSSSSRSSEGGSPAYTVDISKSFPQECPQGCQYSVTKNICGPQTTTQSILTTSQLPSDTKLER